MSDKSLPPGQNEQLRELVELLLERDFAGNKTHAAKKFGVSQSYVSEFLKGTRGAGTTLLEGLADYTGKSVDELMGRAPPASNDDAAPKYGNLPQWKENEPIARSRSGMPGWVFDRSRGLSGLRPAVADVEFIISAARHVLETMSREAQITASDASLDEELDRMRKRGERAIAKKPDDTTSADGSLKLVPPRAPTPRAKKATAKKKG